jgi:hypothetical protein
VNGTTILKDAKLGGSAALSDMTGQRIQVAESLDGVGLTPGISTDWSPPGQPRAVGALPGESASVELNVEKYLPTEDMEVLLQDPVVRECVGGIALQQGVSLIVALRGLLIALIRSGLSPMDHPSPHVP